MRLLFLFLTILLTQTANAQICNATIPADAPNSRYTVRTSTVLDKQTGLIWMRCALGQTWDGAGCTGSPTTMVWQTALQTAESTNFAGKNDWRLPNKKELESLVELRCSLPAINTFIFPNATSDVLWSSSPRTYYSSDAWIVDFSHGNDNSDYKSSVLAVRLVRAGQ